MWLYRQSWYSLNRSTSPQVMAQETHCWQSHSMIGAVPMQHKQPRTIEPEGEEIDTEPSFVSYKLLLLRRVLAVAWNLEYDQQASASQKELRLDMQNTEIPRSKCGQSCALQCHQKLSAYGLDMHLSGKGCITSPKHSQLTRVHYVLKSPYQLFNIGYFDICEYRLQFCNVLLITKPGYFRREWLILYLENFFMQLKQDVEIHLRLRLSATSWRVMPNNFIKMALGCMDNFENCIISQ